MAKQGLSTGGGMNKKGFAERPGAQDRVEFGVSVGWGGNRRKKEKARGGSGKQAGSWDTVMGQ